MFYRSAIWLTTIGALLLTLAILSMVYFSWAGVNRLEPIRDHLALISTLENGALELDNILQQDPELSGDKIEYALGDLIDKVDNLSSNGKFLEAETNTYLQLIANQLSSDPKPTRDEIHNAILILRGVIKAESDARHGLLSSAYQASELLFHTSLWVAIVLVLLTIVCVQGFRLWLIRPLDDLRYLLGLIAQQEHTSAVLSNVNPALKPVFQNYNNMVDQLVEHEKKHSDREQNLQHNVETMTRTLLQQHSALSRAQHLAATGEIAASLAHELRNPLSGMTVALSNLRRDLDNPDNIERLDMVIGELKRTTRLLNDLLDQTHRAPEKLSQISIEDSVYTVFSLLKHQFSDKLTLKSEIDQDLECLLPESGFRQALMNLLLNASEAIGDNEGTIMVRAHMDSDNVIIKICDDGSGFPNDMIRDGIRTFDSRRAGGSGLGLAMVKRFVSDIDGQLRLANQDSGGACVSMSLPSKRCI